ncbi:MAG TPA: hypothetical protein VEQ35_00050, partial [Beijerinckia sp.]|nr:hypothetical protein [Beijerinckia sp.]
MADTKSRNGRLLVPFSNFRLFEGLAEIRECHRRSFFMTVGMTWPFENYVRSFRLPGIARLFPQQAAGEGTQDGL